MEISERDTITVCGGGTDGAVYYVPMRLMPLRNGRRVLHPVGKMNGAGHLVIPARKAARRSNGKHNP